MTNVKTITGASIHEALKEARRQFGDDVVLIESVPAEGGNPAKITILSDSPIPDPVFAEAQPAPALATAGYGYGTARRSAPAVAASENRAEAAESFSRFADPVGTTATATMEAPEPPPFVGGFAPSPTPRPRPERRLFDGPTTPPPTTFSMDQVQQLLDAQFSRMHERMDTLERRFHQSIVGVGQRWVGHPFYTEMLDKGMRTATVSYLFDELADAGYTPDMRGLELREALGDAIRKMLNVPVPKHTAAATVFIGPSGSGKTSLILKLATNPTFCARRKVGVLVIRPHNDAFYLDPTALYRKHGIPAKAVSSPEDMQNALAEAGQFDQILIDTPALPTSENAARQALQRLNVLLQHVTPLDVQFVFNVTRTFESYDAAFLESLPLTPNTLALTHLDESPRWGRVAEWVALLGLPLQFVATGAASSDAVGAFSPSRFVETLLDL